MHHVLRSVATLSIAVSVIGVFLAWAWAPPASAIQPQRWTHSTEADFEAGEMDGVVVTNLGDLKLAAAVEELGELPEDVTVIYDIEVVGDTTYIAAGPEGKLLAMKDGELNEIATFEDEQVFALARWGSDLLVGISGGDTRVAKLNDGELGTIVQLPEQRYIWDILPARLEPGQADIDNADTLVIATGPEGKVFAVNERDLDAPKEVLDSAQANILCLAQGPNGAVYAGTDTDGLIYRIDADGSSYVVYDAAEPEIGALLVTDDGTVYAGTADAEQAKPGRMEDAAGEETGRPEIDGDGGDIEPAELPTDPAEEPQPLDAAAPVDAVEEAAAADAEPPADTGDADADAEQAPATEDPGDTAEIETVGPPSPEQYDALRDEVRKRLLAARKSGALAKGKASGGAKPTQKAKAASGGDKSGNAVYRIDPQGFVSEVFRESVMVLKLAERDDGTILVGTGNEGQLYQIDPGAGETSVLNDLESQQLLALSLTDDGVLVGGANPAALVSLSEATAASGVYTSDVLDATQISLWGTLLLTAEFPAGGQVILETRSGNVADPEIAAWSDWAEAAAFGPVLPSLKPLQPLETKIASPPARYLQYRVTLKLDATALNNREPKTPVIGKVELAYVTPNLRPAVTSLSAAYPDFPGVDSPASPTMSVSWEATDDNGDRLLYDLDYKPASAPGNGVSTGWLTLAEDLTDASFEWDTRKVPDGRYHLRVQADDRLDNPGDMAMTAGRLADPVLIDNTPPAPGELAVAVDGRTATLSGTAADEYSPIHSVAYTVDEAEQYTPVLPEDLIYDSTTEAWSATIRGLAPGGHAVTVRTIDARGNATYTSKLFEIK